MKMNPKLRIRRRIMFRAFDAYQVADRNFRAAVAETADFFPGGLPKGLASIGNPGSRIRRLYEDRDKALQKLLVTRLKLQIAKRRLRVIAG